MSITGGTSDGYFLIRADPRIEYREVSLDGSEDNTKQQKRTSSTFQRFEEVDVSGAGPFVYTDDTGDLVVSPTAKDGQGTTWTAAGTYTITQDSIAPEGKGSCIMVNHQTLKLFTSWVDV